ncbi:MAG TPA: helix-turn-helix domain-containing protein [Bryobacteraceae bacterium]|jgi:excisionase family DNA binding protein|nr:helix-turn-helix domain-containing protein [Bryobacteraceae bacterium]
MKSDLIMTSIIDTIASAVASKLRSQTVAVNTDQIAPRLLTVEQAATYLGRSKEAVQHMVAARKLPVVRDGRRVFLDIRQLDEWINQNGSAAKL